MRQEKVLAVISARGNSKGIPGKNLKPLNGEPLISYMIMAAKQSALIDKVIVSTEDERIAQVAREFGAETPFVRPEALSEDLVPLVSVTKHAMETMDALGFRADIIVQLQPPCPFVPTAKIDESILKVRAPGCDSAVSLKRIEHEHPYRAKEIYGEDNFRSFIKDVDVERFQSRQELPTLYCTSGAIYTRKRHLLENCSGKDFGLGQVARAVFLHDIEAINIDRPIDFAFAEFVMRNRDELIRQGLVSV